MVLSSKLKRDSRSLLAEVLRKMNANVVDFSEIHYDAAAVAFMRSEKAGIRPP